MNKFGLLIALLVFTLMSCSNQNKKETDETTNIDTEVIDSHTSQTSLDWAGVYTGVFPCADCEGIEVELELKDNLTYIAKYTYLGKPEGDNTLTNEGPFTWNDDGNSISLQAEGEPSQYKVGENLLFKLDENGEVVTGRMADVNVLQKKM